MNSERRSVDKEPKRPAGPRLIDLTAAETEDVFAALSVDTARSILARLYDEPMTMSELAEDLDTTIQNVDYHMEKLVKANLVEVVDTIHSEKRREMKVWGPRDATVAVIGTRSLFEYIKERLHVFLRVSIVLLGATALMYVLLSEFIPPGMELRPLAENGRMFTEYVSLFLHEPVVTFFLGGIVVLLGFLVVDYIRRIRY